MNDHDNEHADHTFEGDFVVRAEAIKQATIVAPQPEERWLICYHEDGRMSPDNVVITGDPVMWLVNYRLLGRKVALVSCFQLMCSNEQFEHIQKVINAL